MLDGNVLDLALAFTEPVPRLAANMFTVTGPPKMASTDLEPVDGSDSYFTFSVTLPENYYGSVRVAMNRVSVTHSLMALLVLLGVIETSWTKLRGSSCLTF